MNKVHFKHVGLNLLYLTEAVVRNWNSVRSKRKKNKDNWHCGSFKKEWAVSPKKISPNLTFFILQRPLFLVPP